MTVLCAGIDWSAEAIHVGLIPMDPDHGDPDLPSYTLRHESIPNHDRFLRPAHAAYLTNQLLTDVAGVPVLHVWLEEAYGHYRKTDRALLPIQGAITAAAWRPAGRRHVYGIRPDSWRQTLGLRLRGKTLKDDSITAAYELEPNLPVHTSHHMAEALLIAHAGRHLLWRTAA